MTRLDYLLKVNENVIGWYRQSEDKAKFIVTVNTLIVGVVNGLVFVGADKVRMVGPLYKGPIWVLLAFVGIALVGSFLFVLRAIWARHRTRDASLTTSEHLWFFGDIAAMTRHDYGAAVDAWTEKDLERTMVAQNHILSTNVWTKHEALNRATQFTIAALILLFGLGVAYAISVANMPLQPTNSPPTST